MAESNTLLSDLRKDIRDCVNQWRQNTADIATTAELIIMACVLSDEPLSIPEVYDWVNRHSTGQDENQSPSAWLKRVKPVYVDWRVPVHEVLQRDSRCLMTPTSSANIFLRRRLFRHTTIASQTSFRIMDLPVEIRLSIFEFALSFPRSGVWYDFQTLNNAEGRPFHRTKVWTAERDGALAHAQYSPRIWKTDKETRWTNPKFLYRVDLNAHLSLLRVSKSVYQESLPCYYSSNTFFLPNDWAAIRLFDQFSSVQLSYLGHIVWRLSKNGPPSWRLAQKIATLPRLRTLVIDMPPIDMPDWDMEVYLRLTQELRVKLPPVAAIKGLQDVQFFGPIAEHEDFLRSEMIGRKERSGTATVYGESADSVWSLS